MWRIVWCALLSSFMPLLLMQVTIFSYDAVTSWLMRPTDEFIFETNRQCVSFASRKSTLRGQLNCPLPTPLFFSILGGSISIKTSL